MGRRSWSMREIRTSSPRLIKHRVTRLSLLSTNGIWKELSTIGHTDMVRFQEAFSSLRASTPLVTWTSEKVCSRDFTITWVERLLQPIQRPVLPQPTPIGLLVITESPTSSMSTEICEPYVYPSLFNLNCFTRIANERQQTQYDTNNME